jgi:hypothetical protein
MTMSPAFILEGAASVQLRLVTQGLSFYTQQMLQNKETTPKTAEYI